MKRTTSLCDPHIHVLYKTEGIIYVLLRFTRKVVESSIILLYHWMQSSNILQVNTT